MQITIYRDGSAFQTVNIDDSSREVKRFMSEDFVTLVFDMTEYVDFQIGDYITRNSINYKLNQLPKVTKSSSTGYEYNARFEAPMYDLLNVIYSGIAGRIEHYFNGTIYDYLDLLLNNLDRIFGAGTWTKSVDVFYPNEYKNAHFQGDNCLSALQNICKNFDVRFKIEDKNIIVKSKFGYIWTNKLQYDGDDLRYGDQVLTYDGSYVADPIMTLDYGYTGNLYEITRSKIDSYNLFTRLYARGSYRNITQDYESNEGRLKTGSVDYLEKNTGAYGVIEKSAIFEDVYPSFEGSVGTVDPSDEQVFYDNTINFNINDYLINGVAAKVHFNTGDLAGYSFKILGFKNGQFTIAKYKNDQENELPNSTLKPAAGDKYTILDISLPDEYVADAEYKLQEKAQRYLDENSKPRVKYKVKLTPYYFQDISYTINIGDWVTVDDPQFGTKVVQIIRVSRTLLSRAAHGFEMEIDVSDTEAEEINIRSLYGNQKIIGDESNLASRNNDSQSKSNQSEDPYFEWVDKDGNRYMRIGDLDKILDYTDHIYGFYVGKPDGAKLTIDPVNGIKFYEPNDNIGIIISNDSLGSFMKYEFGDDRLILSSQYMVMENLVNSKLFRWIDNEFRIRGETGNLINLDVDYAGDIGVLFDALAKYIDFRFSGINDASNAFGLPYYSSGTDEPSMASGKLYIYDDGTKYYLCIKS